MSYHNALDLDRHPKNEAQWHKLRDDRYEELLIDIPKQIRSGGSYTTGSGHTRRTTNAVELVALNVTQEDIMTFISWVIKGEGMADAVDQTNEAIERTADQLAKDYVENM